MIQKLEHCVRGTDYGCSGATFSEVIDKVNEVIDYINSRPEEKPSENLKEEVKRYYSDNFTYISSDQPTLSILTNVARHFAEWQKEQMMKDSEEDALLLERAWLTLDGFGHEELAGRLRQFAERKGLIWK